MKTVTISLEDELYDSAQKEAEKRRKSLSELLRDLLAGLRGQKVAGPGTQSGLDDVWALVDAKPATPGTIGPLNRDALYERGIPDTNVLAYAVSRRTEDADKAATARALLRPEQQAISLQVLQEFYRVAVHPRKLAYSHAEAVLLCTRWRQSFRVLEPTLQMFDDSLAICERHQTSYFDAAILAAARLLGCDRVYSEDLSDGQDYGGVRVVNPFRGVGASASND